ncbi:UNVERIFIED_CONTAM: hypothetical protein FKN15_066948 [Acipenser sinensis]
MCLRYSSRQLHTMFNLKTVPVKALPSQDRRNDPESLGDQDFGTNSSREAHSQTLGK